jgi:SRR1
MSGASRSTKHRVQYTSGFLPRNDYPSNTVEDVHFPPDPNYDPDQDEGHTQIMVTTPHAPIPNGYSLPMAWRDYQRCETDWRKSDACIELKKIFFLQIMRQNLPITKCISFSLASPTSPGRGNVSMYQLAAFKTVIDILTSQRSQPPQAFAQDPVFNTLDKQLLARLNIEVINHPAAFHHINFTTFVFCPRAEFFVTRGVLSRSPPIYLGDESLKTYQDPKTRQLYSNLSTSFSEDNLDRVYLTPAEIKEHKRRNASKGAVIVECFKRGRECVDLPDLRGRGDSGWVFDNMKLWWKSSNVRAGPSGC